jgi:hypothetical protein
MYSYEMIWVGTVHSVWNVFELSPAPRPFVHVRFPAAVSGAKVTPTSAISLGQPQRFHLLPASLEQHGLLLPGADVMITIFCDFYQFSAKMAFFLNTDVMINFVQNLALF